MSYNNLNQKSLEKLPPHDIEAEQSVLCDLLLNASALHQINYLSHRDFYRYSHTIIFQAIQVNILKYGFCDLLMLRDELERKKKLDAIGGPAYLAQIADASPTDANITHHAKIIKERSIARDLLNACIETAQEIYMNGRELREIVNRFAERTERVQHEASLLQDLFPWIKTVKGVPKDIILHEYAGYLSHLGFRKVTYNKALFFAQIEKGCIIDETIEMDKTVNISVKDRVKRELREYMYAWELLLQKQSKAFSQKTLSSLPSLTTEHFLHDDEKCCHLFFQNGMIEVQKGGVTFRPYEKVLKYVWKMAVCPFEYRGKYHETPLKGVLDDDSPCEIERFIKHISTERSVIDQDEAPVMVDNKSVFEYALYYLMHGWADPTNRRALCLIDNNPAYFDDGRRGKKIFYDVLRYIRSDGTPDGVVVTEDGKSFEGQFKFQRVTPNTKVLVVNDVDPAKVSLKDFFHFITDNAVIEGKGRLKFAFSEETSPKLGFTTNKPFFSVDRSSTDRLIILPMTEFFAHNHPIQYFGHRLFYDWEPTEWARFFDYLIDICRRWIGTDALNTPEPDLTVFNMNRLQLEIDEVLLSVFDKLPRNSDIERAAFEKDMEERCNYKFKRGELKRALETYVRLKKDIDLEKGADGRYKKNGIEYIRFTTQQEMKLTPNGLKRTEQTDLRTVTD